MNEETLMIELGNALVSLDVIEKQFVCDLAKCKGICCTEGDSGAPLTPDELPILEQIYPIVAPYLPEAGIKAIAEQGVYVIDFEGDYTTPLVNNQECAYTVFETDGTLKCGIEMAWLDKKINFQKPISCHLYPIRISQIRQYESEVNEAVNYDIQSMCSDARSLGCKLEVPVYKFLKAPLIRKYGEEWYKELAMFAENYKP